MKFLFTLLLVATLPLCSEAGVPKHAVVINKGNFQAKVLNSDTVWMLEYYSPRCGTCQDLEPIWKKVADKLKDRVMIGSVDIETKEGMALAEEQGIFDEGIPYVQAFRMSNGQAQKVWTGWDVPTLKELTDLAEDTIASHSKKGSDGKLLKAK